MQMYIHTRMCLQVEESSLWNLLYPLIARLSSGPALKMPAMEKEGKHPALVKQSTLAVT